MWQYIQAPNLAFKCCSSAQLTQWMARREPKGSYQEVGHAVGCTADPAIEGYCEPEPHFLPLEGGDYGTSFTGARCHVQIRTWVPSCTQCPQCLSLYSDSLMVHRRAVRLPHAYQCLACVHKFTRGAVHPKTEQTPPIVLRRAGLYDQGTAQ